ncbi:MAG: response regulator [Candidatus Omnitrophica bacterium]|nr:response regulator [Candidatus Omnitrophota bacterium]
MNNHEKVEVLLVEDNPNDVELTLRALKKNNLVNDIHVVTDGAQALEYVFCAGAYSGRDIKVPPRVILLDLKLPKVDGKEVLRRIKSDERTKAIPVVVLTSSQEERDVIASYQLGVNSYIVKPVDFEKFVNMIAELGLYWVVINKQPVA